MRKGKLILLITLLISFFLAVWIYKINVDSKLTSEENSKVITLVNSYYNNMMNKDYKAALDLVDITGSEYDKAFQTLSNSKGYVVKQRLEGNHWVIPCNGRYDYVFYNKQSNCFGVETGANITYNDSTYQSTEDVFIKRKGKNFIIVKISTDDRFSYTRGPYLAR